MGNQRRIDKFEKLLVVEGYSDLLFFAEVLEHLGMDSDVFIKEFNGAADLLVQLEVFLSPGRLAQHKSIGVIVDADSDANARSQAVAHVLHKATNQVVTHGAWSTALPRIGYFIMPNGSSPGEVETLVWESWANDAVNSSARQCIDSYLGCMSNLGHVATSPDKGKISTLLAVKNDDDPRLGPGARANVFSFARPEFASLLDFLRGL